ncbi:hypothetical protein V9T40_002465 [Parthenolecanium corni]|uniref:G-protein coupled receptors family 1 profile domain-containing protein n=1 Tax=Parthenolecanium corni TaxID=536013 RepID=A0AAN9Y4H5_9HEMI
MVTMTETSSFNNGYSTSTSVHILSEARRKEVKATQNLSVIVLFFILCWMPLYTINCIQAFCSECEVPTGVINSCIILSHLNSAGNPLLYAYRLSDFRSAFRSLFFGSVSSSAENVIYAGRHESDFEQRSSFAKSRNVSMAFDPQKFLFAPKSAPKLFKFSERESNSDVSMSPVRGKIVTRADSSERFLNADCGAKRYDFHRSVSGYAQPSEGSCENRYLYFNGDYVDEITEDCCGRKRIRSVLDDPSYILMINDDNISERTDGTDENSSSKLNVFETRKKILRRHSTNI